MLKKSFKIDNKIYSGKVILQAISDFEDVASISFLDSNLTIESDWEIDEIFNEFMNYVIAIHNES